jgi:hypothetical protein
MVTLVAVVVGGVITMLAQIVLDSVRARAQRAARRDEIRAAVRVIRFHFYAAQHVLKAALETGLWWSGAAGLDLAAAGESLQMLAGLLPEQQWRIYTAASRRLHGCLQRYDACAHERQGSGPPRQVTGRAPGHHLIAQHIEQPDLKFLLGAFVTVDDARRQLQPYAGDQSTGDVPLGQLCLTGQEITEALDEAGHLVDRDQWQQTLRPCASDS